MHRKMSHYIAAFFLILFLFFGTVSVFANDAQCSLHIIKSEEGYFERFGYVNDDGNETIKFSYDKDPNTFIPKDTWNSKVIEEEIINQQQNDTENSQNRNLAMNNDIYGVSQISEENISVSQIRTLANLL